MGIRNLTKCFDLKKTFVFQKNLFLRFSFVFLAKIVIFDSDATSNSHRFMYFRYKDKSFDENTPNDAKNLILKKKIECVCFPSFYDPKNKNWSILVRFLQNRKCLGNRQTMKKITERKQTNFSLI